MADYSYEIPCPRCGRDISNWQVICSDCKEAELSERIANDFDALVGPTKHGMDSKVYNTILAVYTDIRKRLS